MISEKADKMTDLLVGACVAYGCTNSQKIHELLLEAVTQLHTYIAELEAAQRWIPVGERLPVDGQDVLMACTSVFEPYYMIYKGWHSSDSGSPQWSTDNGMYFHTHYCYDRVTHWMSLPEPPEEQ